MLGGLLLSITTLAQIIAGREEDLVHCSNNRYLAELLPNSEIHSLDAATSRGSRRPISTALSSSSGSPAAFQRLGAVD